MKFRNIKLIMVLMIFVLALAVGCKKDDASEPFVEETAENHEETMEIKDEALDAKDQALEEFADLKADASTEAREILGFVENKGRKVLNEVELDEAFLAMKSRWEKELGEINSYLKEEGVREKLVGVLPDGFLSAQDLEELQDSDLKAELKKALDSGYRISMKDGDGLAEVDYAYFRDLDLGSFAWKDYIALKVAEQERPWKLGQGFNMAPKEVVERAFDYEKYFNSYADSAFSMEIKEEYQAMLEALLLGLAETPIAEDGVLRGDFKEAYEQGQNYETTVLGQTLNRYLEVLKAKSWKVDQEVLDGAKRLMDSAEGLLRRTK